MAINLALKSKKNIGLDFSGFDNFEPPLLTNTHYWVNDHIVSVIMPLLPNPWDDSTCDEEAVYTPRLVTLDLSAGTSKMSK